MEPVSKLKQVFAIVDEGPKIENAKQNTIKSIKKAASKANLSKKQSVDVDTKIELGQKEVDEIV